MRKIGYIYSDAFLDHEAPYEHPERKERLIAINARLMKSGLMDQLLSIAPEPASRDDLIRVHDAAYVDFILKAAQPGILDGGDTYFSSGSRQAALLAAGAPRVAVDALQAGQIDGAFCAVRPPGHHAERDGAMGFCIFNNVAVGARYAQTKGYAKVFIVDFDVHHGNGTEHLFESDPTVFYFSSHQYPHYPGTGDSSDRGKGAGQGFTRNIPMPAGAGDREYLDTYTRVLPDLIRGFGPDILFVSAGYDIHIRDPLSNIRVSTAAIGDMVKAILAAVASCPAVFCLEGGYDLTGLSESVAITVERMLDHRE